MLQEAGAVVVRATKSGPRIALVTAKQNPSHWIFPKGHVEAGESLEEAALREAHEEAGVSGRILRKAGEVSFDEGSQRMKVHYYAMATRDAGRPETGRRLAWHSYDDALARLTFDDTRDLLRRAWPAIQRSLAHLSAPGTSERK